MNVKQAIQEALEEADDYTYVITPEQVYKHRGAKEALSELYYLLFEDYYETRRDIRQRKLEGSK